MAVQITVQSYDNMMQECSKIAESLYEGIECKSFKGQDKVKLTLAHVRHGCFAVLLGLKP